MYNLVLALLFGVGIKCENHSAGIISLKNVFELDNNLLSEAKKERIDKQYYVDFNITKQETQTAIEIAEDFNNKIRDFISKLNHQDVQEFRDKFEEL